VTTSTPPSDRPDEENWRELLALLDSNRQGGEPWNEASRRLRRYALRLLRHWPALDRHDAEDITQSVLLKLQDPQIRAGVARRGSPLAYLIVMVRNAAIDLARSREQDRRTTESLSIRPDSLRLERAGADLDQHAVRELLAELTPEERQLLQMRFWQGLSIGEIAAFLEVNYSTAAVRLFRLLKRLRERLGR
jgi:RNA polymerase sigma-70 factor, ECF subfamily